MNNNKGSALLLSISVIAVLTLLGGAYGFRVANENAVALKNMYSAQAFWIAEAGIQKAAWDYNHNDCLGMTGESTGQPCTSCAACSISGNMVMTGTLGNGDYAVTYDPATKTFTSTGQSWAGSGTGQRLFGDRTVKVFFGRDYIFGFAGFSDGNMVISNNSLIDSYNSDDGPYDVATSSSNGNMGTNGGFVDVIDIGNNSVIKGSVSTGPGGTVDYTPSKVTIEGGVSHTNDIYLEPVAVPSDLQAAPYYGSLTVSGTTTISSGSYRYDSISIGNAGTLNFTGDVELYLTNATTGLTTGNNTVAINIADGATVKIYTEGAVDLGNKAIITNNSTNKPPESFMIFSLYDGENGVIIDNNNAFYGAVYAPLTKVIVSNNADFFGSAVGEELELSNNGQMHYDEALGDFQAPWQPLEPRDWQEVFD